MPYKDPITRKFYNNQYYSIQYSISSEQHRKKAVNRRQSLRNWINSFKEQCFKCKTNDKLEFHHIDPREKFKNVSAMASEGYSKKRILDEIEKCIVLCEICHAKLTYG